MLDVIGNLSGGAGSWAAVEKFKRHTPAGTYKLYLVFADTLCEDQDTYRFLIAAAAHLLGVTLPPGFLPEINDFPLWHGDGFDRTPYKLFVLSLRRRVKLLLPDLHWLTNGEDVWDVFLRKRMLGSSRIDPCSYELKRTVLDRWIAQRFDPTTTVVLVGLGPDEPERFLGNPKFGTAGLRARKLEQGWRYLAPLMRKDSPWFPHTVEAEMLAAGLWVQRLYVLGFAHANCSGGCCKAGLGQWRLLLRVWPERYAYCEAMEAFVRQVVGLRHTMLVDRRGGPRKPLSLVELRTHPMTLAEERADMGGCRCALGDDPELVEAGA